MQEHEFTPVAVNIVDAYTKLADVEAVVNEIRTLRIPVEQQTAEVLAADPARAERIGRLLDRIVRPGTGPDPLIEALERTSLVAQEVGLTDEDIDAELAAHKTERNSRVRRIGI